MSTHQDDDREDLQVMEPLRRLPARDPGGLLAERVRRRAQAVLAHECELLARPRYGSLARLFSGVVEPALVAGTVGVYLVWAIRAVEALYR